MQSEAREELQKKPLQDDFFDFSDLPNYSDVAYLRRIIMHSCSNGTTGGGEFRCSQVYDQLLSHFKAYSNDEALQVLLLTFLHGAMLIGRPEVPLRFPAGTSAAPALPMGLLTAALQVLFATSFVFAAGASLLACVEAFVYAGSHGLPPLLLVVKRNVLCCCGLEFQGLKLALFVHLSV